MTSTRVWSTEEEAWFAQQRRVRERCGMWGRPPGWYCDIYAGDIIVHVPGATDDAPCRPRFATLKRDWRTLGDYFEPNHHWYVLPEVTTAPGY